MPKDLVRWIALAACAYILIYVGMHIVDDSGDALPLLFALMAFGTLLARVPAGAGACMAAGALSAVLGTISVAKHATDDGMIFTIGYAIAGVIALGCGLILMRRASGEGQSPTA